LVFFLLLFKKEILGSVAKKIKLSWVGNVEYIEHFYYITYSQIKRPKVVALARTRDGYV
jgi:hypothetical protein